MSDAKITPVDNFNRFFEKYNSFYDTFFTFLFFFDKKGYPPVLSALNPPEGRKLTLKNDFYEAQLASDFAGRDDFVGTNLHRISKTD
ncbi:MAG: hypothetical protein RL757_420 [Bacteroidota bacterium]